MPITDLYAAVENHPHAMFPHGDILKDCACKECGSTDFRVFAVEYWEHFFYAQEEEHWGKGLYDDNEHVRVECLDCNAVLWDKRYVEADEEEETT